MANVPYMDTITLTNANQVYQLFALLSAADSSLVRPAQALLIQADLNAGSARFYIGDPKMQTNSAS